MRRRELIALLGSVAVSWSLAARAQQGGEIRRVGALMHFDERDAFGQQIMEALRQSLQQNGWVEDRNLHIDVRWIGGDEARRRSYAADIVRASPDVIFACFAAQLAALSRETKQIPLVFVGVTDSVGLGYVASYWG